jgi:hypothetical protein
LFQILPGSFTAYPTVFVLLPSILAVPEDQPIVKRLFFIEIVSFDWNCPKCITRQFTEAALELAIAPLQHRIAEIGSEAQRK